MTKEVSFTQSVLTAFALSISLVTIVQAHHGFAFEFDPEQQGTVSGVVTNVRFANPHVVYMLDVEMGDGKSEEWLLLTHNVGVMRQQGWDKQTVAVGDLIEASGSLGRGGTKKLSLDSIVLADGSRRTPRGGEYSDAYTTNEVNANAESFYGITPNDYPIDITGTWNNRYKFRLTVDDLEPKPTPFTEAGRKVFDATENWQDPAKSCKAAGLPRWFGAPFTQEILDAGSHYIMTNPFGTRRVWMNERESPEHLLASPLGFSVGRWEDNVLIIETTHLLAAWLDGSGLPMSGEGTRLVETYAVSDDRLTMEREMTIYDPYYSAPLVRSRGSAREDGLELAEGGSGCDPTSYLRDLWQQGRIETLWND
ncbi:MAG TPA: hypothetical protein DCY55_09930 [Gammaproteobacteria bacterium]|nr:hypothetical protein [Gammaproteobacteria bacterium]